MNKRRQVLTVAALVALGFSRLHAQQKKKPWRIGHLSGSTRPASFGVGALSGMLAGMRDLGYVELVDFVMDWRFADGKYERLDALAADLVAARVDVILTTNPNATRAAQKATATIPIIFYSGSGDPVAIGFVKSLARPGGNITGFSNLSLDLMPKQVELLKRLVPAMTKFALLVNPDNPAHSQFTDAVNKSALTAGLTVLPVRVTEIGQLESGLSAAAKQGAQGMISLGDSIFHQERQKIVALARRLRLPAVYINREFVDVGGLMQYGWDAVADAKKVGSYIRKILHEGAKPADLPVQQSTILKLVLNLKAAKEIDLKVPPEFLLRADEVIE